MSISGQGWTLRTVIGLRKLTAWGGLVFALAAGVGTLGCDKKTEPVTGAGESTLRSAASVKLPGVQPVAAPAGGSVGAKSCPAGRWRYDYSDQALEVMMKSVAKAKVLKKEGAFICDFPSGTKGTLSCSTQGKPVLNVVESSQAGMVMQVSVTLEGKGSTHFELLEGGRMKVTGGNTKDLKLTTEVTLGGNAIPFPAKEMVGIFGEQEAVVMYDCKDGQLAIKPVIPGQETAWQKMKRVP